MSAIRQRLVMDLLQNLKTSSTVMAGFAKV
jgi:hypothetical protein